MPVIVAPEAFDLWLDCATVAAEAAAALIAPAPEALLEHYEVSPAVNRVANDSAELIAPASAVAGMASPTPEAAPAKPKQPDDQLSLF
jgi:putative SOS response-associated peptidase YedK